MFLILFAVSILFLSGLLSLALGRQARGATVIGVGGAVLGCLIGLGPTISSLWTGRVETWRGAWRVPFGSFFVQLDALSAFFLLPILVLAIVAALYGGEYLMAYRSRKNLGGAWFFFNLLVASMVMVVIARNSILFLIAWEIMSLASFFLVTFEDEKESVREAGWTYLVATHLGTAFLLILFLVLGRQAGSLDFDRFLAQSAAISPVAGIVFFLAVIGFGTKAGFIPLHVWLPEAHPAAPSHVSALMSGVMIKTGIYGSAANPDVAGPSAGRWGWTLVVIGLTSGILGVLFALAQHDLKRLLAYHSVENIGIIALGIGAGLLGLAWNQPALAVLGFGGGILHVLNHAVFKSLLFLGAGAVVHSTGTRDIDHLGGLIKTDAVDRRDVSDRLGGHLRIAPVQWVRQRVPHLRRRVQRRAGRCRGRSSVAIAIAAAWPLIGGLAAACFAKAFGVVFLGEPRSDHVRHGQEPGWAMRAANGHLGSRLCGRRISGAAGSGGAAAGHREPDGFGARRGRRWSFFGNRATLVGRSALGLFVLMLGLLVWLRRRLLAGREVSLSGTWDCGYARPTGRMQYTASSFAQPLTNMFGFFLRMRRRLEAPDGFFPGHAALHTETAISFGRIFFGQPFAASRGCHYGSTGCSRAACRSTFCMWP